MLFAPLPGFFSYLNLNLNLNLSLSLSLNLSFLFANWEDVWDSASCSD